MSETNVNEVAAWAKASGVVIPDTPAAWFAARFPGLSEHHGDAVLEMLPKIGKQGQQGQPSVKGISEDFLAASLGEAGLPDAPTVFVTEENRFYTYSPKNGVFQEVQESGLATRLSELLLECARACKAKFDTESLEFRLRDSSRLKGVISRARGVLQVSAKFFETDLTEFVPCINGMLRIKDMKLLAFGPSYRRRNKLAVSFDPEAKCPLFLNTLLSQALDADDIDLLQRWCGLALIGVNMAQVMVILTGTAGGGKGTLIRVLNGIIGPANVGTLRPDLLCERFELGRLLGKSLLYGADVPEDFLNCKGASMLKALTGGDSVTLEYKGSNVRPEITCRFNAIVTCNSRLKVHLEGDADAWRRRLVIIEYRKPKPASVIADLSERILAEEGPGVLNWMLDGLKKIRATGWVLEMTGKQRKLVDSLLLESNAHEEFARDCLRRDEAKTLQTAKCYESYVKYCAARCWTPVPRHKWSALIADVVIRSFGLTLRNDILGDDGKDQRGWKGITCV